MRLTPSPWSVPLAAIAFIAEATFGADASAQGTGTTGTPSGPPTGMSASSPNPSLTPGTPTPVPTGAAPGVTGTIPLPSASTNTGAPLGAGGGVIGGGGDVTAMRARPGGLTADVAATRALKTSTATRIDEAKLAAAGASVDAAWDAYLPKLTLLGRYTRLSSITPPSFGSIPGVGPISFPVILNNYVAQATLLVPLSDYVFRIYDAHKAALSNVDAVKWNARVTTTQTATDARVAYYNWVRARGGVLVAKAALTQSQAHLKDLKTQLALKAATTADVFRVEAQTAAAELAVVRSENLVTVTEASLRTLMHAGDEEAIELGEDLEGELPRISMDVRSLRAAALKNRPELRALDAQLAAAESRVNVAGSVMYPRLDATGNATYARPNQRYVPTIDEFRGSWDVSLQLSWSPTDALIANASRHEAEANAGVLKATRAQLEDALGLDVVNAYARVRENEIAVVSTGAERRSAEEAYRVRIEQFRNAFATSSMLIDAESDLTRARLNELNSRADLRIARAQLRKAIGDL